nr:MAG TPA: crystallin beta/gamma motif-containing protein [Bacteriophage sp.]
MSWEFEEISGNELLPQNDNMAPQWEFEEVNIPAQTVLDDDTGDVYAVPVSFDEADTRFAIATQAKGENKADFFGKVKAIAPFIPLPVNNVLFRPAVSLGVSMADDVKEKGIKQAVNEWGENIEHSFQSAERGIVGHIGDATDTALHAMYHVPEKAKMLEEVNQGNFSRWGENLSDEEKQRISDKVIEANRWIAELRAKNKAFWDKGKEILRPEAEMDSTDRLFEGLGSAGASIGEAVVATMATKNPNVAAGLISTLYGRIRYTEYFDKAREAGMDIDEADFNATVAGTIEGGIELAGERLLMGIAKFKPIQDLGKRVITSAAVKAAQSAVGKSAIKKIGSRHTNSIFAQSLKGFAAEGGEEAAQTYLGMQFENMTNVSDYSDDEILRDTLFSLAVGGLTGSGTAAVGTSIYNNRNRAVNNKIKKILETETPELTPQESQTMADAVQEMLFQETGSYIQEMNHVLQKELDTDVNPEGIDVASMTEQTRKILKEKYQMSDEEIDKTLKASLGMIDARNQFNEAYNNFYEGLSAAGRSGNYADAEARILAARATTLARAEKTDVKNVLERWNLRFQQEKSANLQKNENVREQAMYKSPLTDITSFYNDVLENPNKKKRYFSHVMPDGTNIDIMSDVIAHDQKHNMSAENWQELIDNFDNFENFVVSDKPRFDGRPVLMKIAAPSGKYGVVFERLRNGRNIITTAFKGTDKGIDNWMKKETGRNQSLNMNAADALPSQPVALEAENTSSVAFASQQSEISDNPISDNADRSFKNIIAVLDKNVNKPVAQGGQNPRGAYQRSNQESIIYLFENADASTVIHELGHFFLDDMRRFSDNETTKTQLDAIYEYVGSTDGKLTEEQHEYFANSFEVYLLDGRAPNTLLGKVFARFRKWIGGIWSEVRRLDGIKLNDGIRKTFDDMLGGRSLDFAMQVSGQKMAESLESGIIAPNVVSKAIRLLDEGKMSRADMDALIERLKNGELKRRDFNQELKKFDDAAKGPFAGQKLSQDDLNFFMKKLSAGYESAKKAMYLLKVGKMSQADMRDLIAGLKSGQLNYFDFSDFLKKYENSNRIHSEVVTDKDRTYYKRQLEAGIVDYPSAMRAINMLKEGKISKKILKGVIKQMEDGEISPWRLYPEIAEYDVIKKQNREALNPFDKVKYKELLSRGNFSKTEVVEKINQLLKWTEPRTQGGKVVGRFPNLEMNRKFDHIRELMAMTKEEAREKIAENVKLINAMIRGEETGDMNSLVFDNKILSIPAKKADATLLLNIYNAIADSYNAGRLTTAITAEAKRKRKARMIGETVDVLTNGGTVDWRRERSKARQFINQLGTSQMSWSGLLDILSMNDKSSRTGQSALSRNLDVFEAEQAEALGVADDGEKASRLIEKKLAGADNSGISLSRYVNQELKKETTIEWGHNRRTFTKDQLLDIWMKSQDQETRKLMKNDEVLQYNDDFLAEVNEVLTAQDRAVANALFEFYDDNYQKINAFYEDKYGTSLGKRPFYSPRSMDRGGINVDTGDVSNYAGFSGVKQRTANAGAVKIKGAFAVLQDYIVNSNHWIAWSDKLIDINGVMGDVKVKNIIRNLFGKKMESRIGYEVSRMASNDKFQKNWFGSEMLNKIRSNYAVSVLAVKPALMIKQLTSFPAYWEHMSTAEFMEGLKDFALHPKEAVETLGNTTLMKTRDVNIIKDFAELSKLELFKKNTGKIKLRELMMANIKLGDRGAIYIGGWALYKAELRKNLAAGMNETEAKKKALEKFERVTDETQQSGRLSQQSYWQSNPFLRAFTMFQSSQNQYLRKEINAVRGLMTGRMDKMQVAKTLFIFHILLPCFFQWASDGFDWDKKAQLRAALLGSLNGIFLLNSVLEKGLDIALGTDDSWQATRLGLRDILPPWATIEDIGAFFVKFAEDDVEVEDVMRAIKSFGEFGGIPVKYPLDVIKNFGSYAEEGEYFKEVLLWLGWSPYALREKDEE